MCPNEAAGGLLAAPAAVRDHRGWTGGAGAVARRSAAEIDALRAEWTPKLRRLVETINENFKRNFAAIGCAGEVRLREDPGGDCLDLWKLEIWVKFRAATDMHILDAHRQSGGERSVSTMLYLISLQELTRAPFRVVGRDQPGHGSGERAQDFRDDGRGVQGLTPHVLSHPEAARTTSSTPRTARCCASSTGPDRRGGEEVARLQETLQPAPPADTPP